MAGGCRIKINHFTLAQGASVIEATEHELGYKLDADYGAWQVSARGLGGTTYAVHVLIPGVPGWWHQVATGKGETDVVHIDEKYVVRGIKVTPADAELAASMVATVCGIGRTLRFSNG